MMKLPPLVGVVTHNPMATLRFELLERTVRSIEQAFPTSELFLLDNGSTDDSWSALQEMLGDGGIECPECGSEQQRGRWHVRSRRNDHPLNNYTPGAGRHRLWRLMYGHVYNHRSPFWVFSDDDMVWKLGAEAKLRRFWGGAPDDIAIVSGLLEPVWHWNTPRGTVEAGAVRVLVRDSAPGAAWTFSNPRKIWVGCSGDSKLYRFGYDYESCKLLRSEPHNQRVAQIDLAEHIGWECSTHGNDADQHLDGKPLDRDKWGV